MRIKEGNKEKVILDAAVKLMAAQGFHRTQISKVAETAGVATGSVYLYYKNKEALLKEILRQIWENLTNSTSLLLRREDMNPTEKFEAFIDIFFDIFTENTDLAKVFINEQDRLIQENKHPWLNLYNEFLETGEKIFEEGIRKKSFNQNIDTSLLRSFTYGGIKYLLHSWAVDPKAYPINSIRQTVKFVLKKGILK